MTWLRTSRWVRPALAALGSVSALGALALAGTVARAATVPYSDTSSVPILSTGSDSPMFTAHDLEPGSTRTACVDVSVAGASSYDSVVFTGSAVSGALAPYLDVDVVAGVPAGDSCDDFSGALVFDGSLPQFASPSGDGYATGWAPTQNSTWRFRVSVSVAQDAPHGISATAAFQWRLHTGVTPALSPSPSVAAIPPVTRPLPQRHESPSAPQHVTIGQPQPSALGKMLSISGAVAAALLRHPGYPVGFVVLAIIFMVIQDVLDRRDPKLALAPMRSDDLRFTPVPQAVTM